ncbi:MAG: 2,3-bisphosphoglycerate-independent phosphoglycerate mutase, partial [SAR324 cluster bacterium]|nr:2,3-bisphosphoglycerate-independent phosphoglycerate mutase [SAR324 cluster bacterium]
MSELTEQFKGRGQLLWIVLDGWGLGDHGEGDAIHQAFTPHIDSLGLAFASTRLYTHGHYVGLPAPKDIGGSEVGHITMGAGRTIPQGPTRIKDEMDSGRFFSSEALTTLIGNCLQGDAPLHLL